jgi:hypothetical protein
MFFFLAVDVFFIPDIPTWTAHIFSGNYSSKIVCLNIRRKLHIVVSLHVHEAISLLVAYRIWRGKGVLAACFLVLWGITPCSSVKANWRFGGPCHHHLQSVKQTTSLLPIPCQFLAWLTLHPWRFMWHVPPKRQPIFIGLHGCIPEGRPLCDSSCLLCHSLNQKTDFRTLRMKFRVV